MTDSRANLGDFTCQADSYERGRPSYPDELLKALIAHARPEPGAPVADIGAGTGILSRQLADHGFAVTAIEPNETMRTAGAADGRLTWIDGTFERTGLPEQSQRWITAAQAFHWANVALALPELYRICQPGGHLTVLFNNRLLDANTNLRRTTAIICEIFPEYTQPYRSQEWAATISNGDYFGLPHYHEADHVHRLSRAGYVQLWRSINRLHTGVGPKAHAEIVRRIEADLTRRGIDEVEVPYRCCAWTARRRG